MKENKLATITNLFEGRELVSTTNQLKMQAKDGKFYHTDTLNMKGILRLIESVSSQNAELFCTK